MVTIQTTGSGRLRTGGLPPLNALVSRSFASGDEAATPDDPFYESSILSVASAGIWNEFTVSLPLGSEASLECLTPATGAFNGNVLERVGSGGAVIIRAYRGNRQQLYYGNNASSAGTLRRFNGFEASTIANALFQNIDNRLSGSDQINLFNNWSIGEIGGPEPSLVRNTNCWAHGIDLSAIPIQTTLRPYHWGSENKGAAITAQHMIGASHWNGYTGSRIGQQYRFLGDDNVIYTRTCVGKVNGFSDIEVMTLDSPLPAAVTPMKVCPWFHRNKIVSGASGASYNGGVFFYVDQTYSCRLMLGAALDKVSQYTLVNTTLHGESLVNVPLNAGFVPIGLYNSYSIPVGMENVWALCRVGISGDSGSPIMALSDDDEPVLVTSFFYPEWGPTYDTTALNACIAAADADAISRGGLVSPTGYTVTEAAEPTI